MLNITTISDVIYRDFRYNLIRIAEGCSATPYIDSKGNVAIGEVSGVRLEKLRY